MVEPYLIIMATLIFAASVGIYEFVDANSETQAKTIDVPPSETNDRFIQPVPLCNDAVMCYRDRQMNSISCFQIGSQSEQWQKYCRR